VLNEGSRQTKNTLHPKDRVLSKKDNGAPEAHYSITHILGREAVWPLLEPAVFG